MAMQATYSGKKITGESLLMTKRKENSSLILCGDALHI